MSGWKEAYRPEGDVLTPCRGIAMRSQLHVAKAVCAAELRTAEASADLASYLREKRDAVAYQSARAIQMLRDFKLDVPKGSE